MSSREPSSMVAGGEALRLKHFLLDQKLELPRVFHRVVGATADVVEERVSGSMLVDALESAMRITRCPSLPVDFGSAILPANMGIYGLAILTALTFGDALERSARFQRLMTSAARIHLERSPRGARWVWCSTDKHTLGVRIRNEIVLTEHVAIVRALVPDAIPRKVSFMHSAPVDCGAHDRYFGCPIAWEMDEDSVEWAAAGLQRPLGTEPLLSEFIEREAERQLKLLPETGSLDEVRHAVLQRLPTGNINLPTIAAVLGRAPRTLRRELANAGCPYRTLVDGVRRQRAIEMATDGKLSMTDIALKLGFSELSAFSRAWHRWFNQPFRATHN